MADRSAIEWTDATWNPIRARSPQTGKTGWHCEHASEGCRNCYAERLNMKRGTSGGTRFAYKPGHLASGAVEVFLDDATLFKPLRWRKGRTIFVCSMTDLFADFVSDEWLDKIFAVIMLCPQHRFLVLTKRADRMRAYVTRWYQRRFTEGPRGGEGLLGVTDAMLTAAPEIDVQANARAAAPYQRNLWLGVSVEDQEMANKRLPHLLETPAAVRFLSCEPLLGALDLTWIEFGNARGGKECWDALDLHGLSEGATGCRAVIDWVICGGESGKDARPMHPRWARSLRDQCASADVPFFFKQWGEWGPDGGPPDGRPDKAFEGSIPCAVLVDGTFQQFANWIQPPIELCSGHGEWVYRFGKRNTGRLLDGALHDEMPA